MMQSTFGNEGANPDSTRVFRIPTDDVTLWCAAVDPALDERAYIVPGLGDAGDLSFGAKL